MATPNWLELPRELTKNILKRIGLLDILGNAEKVCTTWRDICKDPSMWREICICGWPDTMYRESLCRKLCKEAIDRSQGQLVDLTISYICDDDLLQYIADRSSQLKRLGIVYYFPNNPDWREAFEKFPLLEELRLVWTVVSQEDIEFVSRCCPLLKTLKVNDRAHFADEDYEDVENDIALTVGENLHELTHLELINNTMDQVGLQAILDGCGHLESLDLRGCSNVDLEGKLWERCSQQIKCLKHPSDSEWYLYVYRGVDKEFRGIQLINSL